jgi:hypothetical protein
MAKREDIETAFWSDPDVLALSGPARAIYLWSFTNSRTGMSGFYKVAPELIALETGFKGRALESALDELRTARFLFYDGRVMFVRTKVRRARNRSTNIAKSIRSDVYAIGDHPFVGLWWQENAKQGWVTDEMEKPEGNGDLQGSSMPSIDPSKGVHGYVCVSVPVSEGVGGVGGEDQTEVVAAVLPADFPDELVPHLDAVERILTDLAVRHEAKALSRLALASVIAANPRKALVAEARGFTSWADDQPTARHDVLAGYRNWLKKSPSLAATERLNGGGPLLGLARPGRKENASDWLQEDFVDGEPIVDAQPVEDEGDVA